MSTSSSNVNVPSLNEELSEKIQASENTRRTNEDSMKITDVPIVSSDSSAMPIKLRVSPSKKFQSTPVVQQSFKNPQPFVSQQHTQMVIYY